MFDKILKDPEACERLMQTFYGEIDSDLELVGGYLPPEQFAKALFDAYKNRDLTAFLMAVCKNSMFDLLRNSFLAPFRFNADGQVNPYLLTDEDGNLIQTKEIHVSEKDYNRFKKVFRKEKGVKMYLAYGYRKRHSYDADTMDVMEYKMGEHIGLLLVYELPDTVKQQRTEAQAYAAVWDIMMKLQKDLPLFITDRILWKMKVRGLMNWAYFYRSTVFRNGWKRVLIQQIRLYMHKHKRSVNIYVNSSNWY